MQADHRQKQTSAGSCQVTLTAMRTKRLVPSGLLMYIKLLYLICDFLTKSVWNTLSVLLNN